MVRRVRRPSLPAVQPLEVRQLLSSLSLAADWIQPQLPADASVFPTVTLDVLENDTGNGLRITELAAPQLGTVELLPDIGPDGQGTVKYTPGPGFRGRDAFSYSVVDENGDTAVAAVFIQFEQDPTLYPWQVLTVPEVVARAGVSQPLRGEDGTPAVQVEYTGEPPAEVGVLLQWSFVSGGFSGLQYPGSFTTETTRDDAQLSVFSGGTAWIYGSIAGVNTLLQDMVYVPERGFSAPEGVQLGVISFLYSSLGVNLGSEHRSLTIRVEEQEFAPRPGNDLFVVRTSLEPTFLDVAANDESGVVSNVLELMDVQLGGHSSATVSIDADSQRLVYQPPVGFMGTDVITYVVRNAAGIEAQGRVEVNVMPPILALLSTTGSSTRLEVINAETMGNISQFEAFSGAAVDSLVEVADLDSDGFMEIVVWQTGGERRMRSFNAHGGLLTDTVMAPFGSRFSGPMDLAIGDLDDDGRAEMVVAGTTSRGYEVRAIDIATGQTEMSMSMRGMTGTPQVAVNEESDEIVILGRSAGGGVSMAMMDVDGNNPQQVIRRTLINDRDARNLQRQNGPITSLTLSTADLDGNGATDAVVGMTFGNGAARVMTAGGSGAVRTMLSTRLVGGTQRLLLPASNLFTASGAMVGWWSSTSLGMFDSAADPLTRPRIIAVALG